ncbi:MAG: hypothetical protein KDD46_05955, partial [Bdellovibrionales bacterium]|nr:hypothetical protein [Bdellovibrionales bacterium]
YYDGNAMNEILDSPCIDSKSIQSLNQKLSSAKSYQPYVDQIEKIYKDRSGKKLDALQKCVMYDVLSLKDQYSSWISSYALQKRRHRFNKTSMPTDFSVGFTKGVVESFTYKDGQYYECQFLLDKKSYQPCSIFKGSIVNALSGQHPPINEEGINTYPWMLGVVDDLTMPTEAFEVIGEKSQQQTIRVKENQVTFVDIQQSHHQRKIIFELENPYTSKIVISGTIGKSDEIHAYVKKSVKEHKKYTGDDASRYDVNLLTSCITFIDTEFDGGTILVEDMQCEDGLNLIRSHGTVDSIKVYHAYQDAIDIDFSNIKIRDIVVKHAGNDCLDVSSGQYSIENANLMHCGDKGISIGERSTAQLGEIIVQDAQDGVVSKDQSSVRVEYLKASEIKHQCLSSFQKKQEFGGASLVYAHNKCDAGIYRDPHSEIHHEETRN